LAFFSSKADSVRRSAMTVAVVHARADAMALALAAGGTLGPLIEIVSADQPSPPIFQRVAMGAAPAPKSTPVEAGEQTFSATVTVRWAFIPGR